MLLILDKVMALELLVSNRSEPYMEVKVTVWCKFFNKNSWNEETKVSYLKVINRNVCIPSSAVQYIR